MEQRNLLSVKEMAAILRVPPSWIYQRTRFGQGGIPHLRVGKYIRFESEAVIAFYKKQVLTND